MSVKVGDKAPDIVLQGTGSREYKLSDYLGQPVVIVFYPGDGTAVCTKQLNDYNDELGQFANVGAQVLAISSQGLASKEDFTAKHGFGFPLLADVDKTAAKAYGILGPLGFPRRSVFVVDAKGVIRYVHRALAGVTYRPVTELIEAINAAR